MLLDQYIAIADYRKQAKNELSLVAGDVVEVFDKNENGEFSVMCNWETCGHSPTPCDHWANQILSKFLFTVCLSSTLIEQGHVNEFAKWKFMKSEWIFCQSSAPCLPQLWILPPFPQLAHHGCDLMIAGVLLCFEVKGEFLN